MCIPHKNQRSRPAAQGKFFPGLNHKFSLFTIFGPIVALQKLGHKGGGLAMLGGSGVKNLHIFNDQN